jgi:hypothetical protein
MSVAITPCRDYQNMSWLLQHISGYHNMPWLSQHTSTCRGYHNIHVVVIATYKYMSWLSQHTSTCRGYHNILNTSTCRGYHNIHAVAISLLPISSARFDATTGGHCVVSAHQHVGMWEGTGRKCGSGKNTVLTQRPAEVGWLFERSHLRIHVVYLCWSKNHRVLMSVYCCLSSQMPHICTAVYSLAGYNRSRISVYYVEI